MWQTDANYHDVSGLATFTADETKKINEILSFTGKTFSRIPGDYLDMFKHQEKLQMLAKTFINSRIKQNIEMVNADAMSKEFIHYVLDKYEKQIKEKKKPETIQSLDDERRMISNVLMKHGPGTLSNTFQLMLSLAQAKQIIINKMNHFRLR